MSPRRTHPAVLLAIATLVAACPPCAWAHDVDAVPAGPGSLWTSWEFDPGVVIPIVFSAWLYVQGLVRLWHNSGVGRGVRRWEAGAFAGGWLALVIALVSPIHPLGQVLFSAHMTQHEILMLVAAPLLVLGRPMVVFLWALPPNWTKGLTRITNSRSLQAVWHAISHPFAAFLIHGVVLWVWHVPVLFDATLDSDLVHAAQHLSFLLSAVLFWWAVFHGRQRAVGYGLAVVYMFLTAVHSGILGALLTFARTPWYPAYANTTQRWGLAPVEDQQLGGLIMWVPACTVYIVAGLALMAAWLRESDRRVMRREQMSRAPVGLVGPPERQGSFGAPT